MSGFNDTEKDLPQAHLENVHDANLAHITEAINAEELEHMGVLAAFKMYPKATFWSFCVSFVIVGTS